MSTLSLRLPNSLHRQAKALAEKDDISLNQFITVALAEKVAVTSVDDYLAVRAARAARQENPLQGIDDFLADAPDVAPPPEDRLPEEAQ